MRAGVLDRQITFEVFAIDTDGDPTDGQWSEYATVYAAQMEQSQARQFVTDQELAAATRAYRVRYRTDVTPGEFRVKHGEEYWQIVGVSEGDGRRTETVVLCERYNPNERVYE